MGADKQLDICATNSQAMYVSEGIQEQIVVRASSPVRCKAGAGEQSPSLAGSADIVLEAHSSATARERVARADRYRSVSRATMGSMLSMQTNLNMFVSDAVSEVRHGVEPLVQVFVRLVTYHRGLLYGCIVLVVVGVAGGMLIEGWSFLTSLYVIVQISTTIGYGDVTVDREFMQLFMTLYVLAVLFVMANFLNVLLNAIIKHHSTHLHNRLLQLEVAVNAVDNPDVGERKMRKFNEVIVSGTFFMLSIIIGTVFFRLVESCTCSYGTSKHDHDLESCNPESHETCMATNGVSHTWLSALYMSVITVTTVGFGDYTPKSQTGRTFAIFWMICSVAVTALFISAVSKVIASDPDIELGPVGDIDEEVFKSIDLDGNGQLTKAEYTRYVMVKHGLLPLDVLKEIDLQFDAMDVNRAGAVTLRDIQLIKGKAAAETGTDQQPQP